MIPEGTIIVDLDHAIGGHGGLLAVKTNVHVEFDTRKDFYYDGRKVIVNNVDLVDPAFVRSLFHKYIHGNPVLVEVDKRHESLMFIKKIVLKNAQVFFPNPVPEYWVIDNKAKAEKVMNHV